MSSRGAPSRRISRLPCTGPAPPNAHSVKSDGASPRSTDITFSAPTMLLSTISTMPRAASSSDTPSGAATSRRMAASRLCAMQRNLAIEQVRRHTAEHQVGVGHRRAAPTLAIGRGPRISTGTFRPDRQRTFRAHRRNRAAACADGMNINDRQRQRKFSDAARRGRDGLAIADQRHVGARAAHVDGDEVVVSGNAPDVRRPPRAGRRP